MQLIMNKRHIPQSAADTSDTPYEKGTITDTDFQSEWLNLKFTPPETVVMNTEEELQSVMKQGQTTLEESSGVETWRGRPVRNRL